MNLVDLGRLIIIMGILLVVAGGFVYLLGSGVKLPRLPGDILYRRDGMVIYIPIVTMIVISILLTILLNFFIRR